MAQERNANVARKESQREKIRVIVRQRKRGCAGDAPIPGRIYPVIDTDLGRDNVETHLPAADREDLQ